MEGTHEGRTVGGRPSIAVLNILIRDANIIRQRLFSYAQFYLSIQAGVVGLFGLLLGQAAQLEDGGALSEVALIVGAMGLVGGLVIFSYGALGLHPSPVTREWIRRDLERLGPISDDAAWGAAILDRIRWLSEANRQLDQRIRRIRAGVILELLLALFIFTLVARV